MKKWVLACVLVVTGCVSFQELDEGLRGLVGQDKTVAFKILGYPDNQQTFDDTKVYTWVTNSTGAEPYVSPQTTSGTVNGKPFEATTAQTTFVPVSYSCKIQISTDRKGVIKDYKYTSTDPSVMGCMNYIKSLNNYYKR